MTPTLVDSHNHIDMPAFDEDREAVLARAREAGIEAMLVVADARRTFLLSGTGDLIEPDDGILGIGSGATAAVAAARALAAHTTLDARAIVVAAMDIAAATDVYTNDTLTVEEL